MAGHTPANAQTNAPPLAIAQAIAQRGGRYLVNDSLKLPSERLGLRVRERGCG